MAKNLTQEEIHQKIDNESDFVFSAKHNNSLEQLIEAYPLEKYPNGCPDKVIAKALKLESEEEVEMIYQGIIRKLRQKIVLDS